MGKRMKINNRKSVKEKWAFPWLKKKSLTIFFNLKNQNNATTHKLDKFKAQENVDSIEIFVFTGAIRLELPKSSLN
jgi:hypothetical protein